MATSYADSAQAREWDKRFDELGKPRVSPIEFAHEYDAKSASDKERFERASLSRRLSVAIAKMERVCPPVSGESS